MTRKIKIGNNTFILDFGVMLSDDGTPASIYIKIDRILFCAFGLKRDKSQKHEFRCVSNDHNILVRKNIDGTTNSSMSRAIIDGVDLV